MNWRWFYVAAAVFSVCLLQEGFTLKCYTCKSKRDGTCGYPSSTNSVPTEECPGIQAQCYHYDYNIEGDSKFEQFVQRGCMSFFQTICPSKPIESITLHYQCNTCLEDECNGQLTMLKKINGGSSIRSTFILVAIMSVVLIESV